MKLKRLFQGMLATTALLAGVASAQVSVMLPANPGGGWDGTGRNAFSALNKAGIYTGTVNYTNKGGAGGTIGLAEFARTSKGKNDQIAVFGAITVGAITLNNSPVKLSNFKPIARLTAEHLVLAVSKDAPYQTLAEFVEALKANPGATPVGGGSAGGVDHIALALLAQASGADVAKLNYIPQAGGTDTVTGIVNGTLKAGLSGISEFQQFAETGRIRILGITSAERMEGLDVPTFKEQGFNVEIANWRGVLGGVDMPEANHKEWIKRFEALNDSAEWKEVLKTQGWTQYFLAGEDFAKFIQDENERINKVLKDAGISK
ncbi:Bug family tripartite tricarboxylate transporter substrate binding protein [Pelistega suis]|uniref:Bug family tripartite tricarboxylate transporter substrate binding protein n=1 Tax=Pelistega suis TaxID=1631957 RepID=UPI00211BC0A3|nr:tripartite tricarboxylate transporter substrate binding protein [Pelistega suis]MCQ9329578.1 tripartite tricarboxylate transporter substrate binding protein [Pelistega suis]